MRILLLRGTAFDRYADDPEALDQGWTFGKWCSVQDSRGLRFVHGGSPVEAHEPS